MRARVLAAAGVLALAGASVAVVASADGDPSTASCTPSPKVTSTDAGSEITLTCTVPSPPAVTETVTVPGPTVTVTATPTPEPSATPTPSQTPTPSVTPTPSPTPSSTPTVPPTSGGFPTASTVGLPPGWTPKKTVNGNYTVSTAGAVIEDLQVNNGQLIVDAPNVTLRRVKLSNSRINLEPRTGCKNGTAIDTATFTSNRTDDQFITGPGGYSATNVLLDGVVEGFRDGGKSVGCGPVSISNAFIRVAPPVNCVDWHGDGIQGYDGPALTIRNVTIIMQETSACGGTAPFFVPSGQGNTSIDVDGLLVSGGGYSFRAGVPGTVRNLHVIDRQWGYAPADVKCSVLTTWQASISTLGADGQPKVVRPLGCSGVGN